MQGPDMPARPCKADSFPLGCGPHICGPYTSAWRFLPIILSPASASHPSATSSAIKHTIHGDANITDDVESIRNLMNMNYDIKR